MPPSAQSDGKKAVSLVARGRCGHRHRRALFVASNDLYAQVFSVIAKGIGITIFVTLMGFTLASLLGLGVALMGLSGSTWLRQVARFYVEIIRGVPILVLLFWIAFVGAPALVAAWNLLSFPLQACRHHWTDAGARFFADVAGDHRAYHRLFLLHRRDFQGWDTGSRQGPDRSRQGLGLSRYRRFRHIVWPQAFRIILPPYGNDFIAMVKDSSLVSVLGVADITQMGKIYASGSFRFFETYSIVAYIYLILTVGLSLALRALERRMRRGYQA